ncbi:acyl-CoA dehydrogenase family protein [Comamonas humi]
MTTYSAPWIDPELQAFQDAVRRVIDRELVPHEERWWHQGYIDREAWNRAGAGGLLLASIPEAYGGGGGSFAHDAIITLEQALAGATSLANGVHSGIVAHYILAYAGEEQKRRWLPRMASGEFVGAIAMTEPGIGSDLQNVATRAVREGDHYRISGAKTFITNGLQADLVLVVAKTDPTLGARGVSIIGVETKDLPGFRRGRLLEKIGQKGTNTVELFFDDVRVPCENLLGQEEGQGFFQLMQQLPKERMIVALGAQATMLRAVDVTVDYVRQRQVFGAPLLDLQNTRFTLAECQTAATVTKAFVDDCMAKVLQGMLDSATASMAKWWCTQKNCEIIDECLQLHGGYGYMLEYPIARMYANARVGKIYGGSNEIMKEIIARRMEADAKASVQR